MEAVEGEAFPRGRGQPRPRGWGAGIHPRTDGGDRAPARAPSPGLPVHLRRPRLRARRAPTTGTTAAPVSATSRRRGTGPASRSAAAALRVHLGGRLSCGPHLPARRHRHLHHGVQRAERHPVQRRLLLGGAQWDLPARHRGHGVREHGGDVRGLHELPCQLRERDLRAV